MRPPPRIVLTSVTVGLLLTLTVASPGVSAREVAVTTTINQGPADPQVTTIPKAKMADFLKRWKTFKTFSKALETAGMVEELNQGGPFTVFVPDDAAFARLPKATLDALMKDRVRLRSVLRHHIVKGRVDALTLFRAPTLTDLDGRALKVTRKPGPGGVQISGSPLIGSNLMATNGVAHVVGTVILSK